ncbi:transcription antitermination factor NusB [Apibacter muscae]|uniref:Transcription antitermination factor NusB n=1 Tax=Apibacter muscae TaxID=2509004 RepID=A0A563DK67_9FLAO|nr:transcription antitermination factor NusB [Apibacter muscae]TWP30626.1 transcription antitermination factor NusB [Apibacter muscae]
MLGRRQLREKILQALYAYNIGGNDLSFVEQKMFQAIDEIYHLYIYELNLLLAVRDYAQEVIEKKRNKRFATEEEKNPNLKFVNNKIFQIIENCKARKEFSDKHSELLWYLDTNYPAMIFKKFQNSTAYLDYMKDETLDFEKDKKIILKLFFNFIADNPTLYEWFEEIKLFWADDIHVANNMTLKTLKSLEENKPLNNLIQVLKPDDSIPFAKNLLRTTISYYPECMNLIKERSNNWELDRIAEIDKIILSMGFTELNHSHQIPAKVVINECIELAKVYSSNKSNIFINGILDKYARDINKV